jgi:purine-cytosine permease-like protein
LAIAGASNFEAALTNLLVILSYWLSIYCIILIEEHYIFKRGDWSNYNLEFWNDRSKMPLGLAAAGAVICGAIGAVLGMAQVLYVHSTILSRKFD